MARDDDYLRVRPGHESEGCLICEINSRLIVDANGNITDPQQEPFEVGDIIATLEPPC
jgi:hypothetical protein